VTNAEGIASKIVRRTSALKLGTLSVYGDIFGGRIDNVHVVTGAHVLGPRLVVIEFNDGETLDVWDPEGGTISEADFKIQTASRVRWEWFTTGGPMLRRTATS
jgi:hypothetical protein